jgi:deoxyribodipyrimidine photolyase-like uncharacterized protein
MVRIDVDNMLSTSTRSRQGAGVVGWIVLARWSDSYIASWLLQNRLSDFDPYQDAMVSGEQTMWHTMLSPYRFNSIWSCDRYSIF